MSVAHLELAGRIVVVVGLDFEDHIEFAVVAQTDLLVVRIAHSVAVGILAVSRIGLVVVRYIAWGIAADLAVVGFQTVEEEVVVGHFGIGFDH